MVHGTGREQDRRGYHERRDRGVFDSDGRFQSNRLTVGGDGNIWFTEEDGNKIGEVTDTGTVTEYSIPTSASGPGGIAMGRDGNLWFTEFTGNKIGKVTLAGVFTEFPLPEANSDPSSIVADAVGRISGSPSRAETGSVA